MIANRNKPDRGWDAYLDIKAEWAVVEIEGKITALEKAIDALLILQYLVELIDTFPTGK